MWQLAFDLLKQEKYVCVMVAVGCSLKYHEEITSKNNQQYPDFLNQFSGKKLIILIDPFLENPIKLLEQFPIEIKLELAEEKLIWYSTLNKSDEEKNKEDLDVLANYTNCDYSRKDSSDISNIYDLVMLCLDSQTKLIWQDYTGYDPKHFFFQMIQNFESTNLLDHVIFDVTQHEGGCFVDLSNILLTLDDRGNFIQERWLQLKYSTKYPNYNKILTNRIHVLRHPLLWKYKNNDNEFRDEDDIYGSNISVKILKWIYGHEKLYDLIISILIDICSSQGITYEDSIYEHFFNNIHTYPENSEIYNAFSKCLIDLIPQF